MSDAEKASHTRLNLSAGLLSSAVALTLVVAKLWALDTTGSLAVAATLADSAMDLMMSLGALAAIAYAAKPADEDHNFGHSSAEDLAALAQSVIILLSAAAIAGVAVWRLLQDDVALPQNEGSGIAVVVLAIVLTLGLVVWQRRVAARTGNAVVRADSLHYLGDLVPNVGAIVALWASSALGIGQVDSVVALGAAVFLAVGALRIGREAWNALMDAQADPAMIAGIERLARDHPGVRGFHDLKTRRAGSQVFVNLHIELDGDQSLLQAHDIGAGLRHAILDAYPQTDVLIHKDPVRPGREGRIFDKGSRDDERDDE
ncbi:cation diffusion facilitator family transporter [Salipiger sp. IMCC34102]|uniref:cation diffusion facilitator family transporter n=1 Tax=Salipiger sp. IMCC34102 TaxID=2510647 RepID=UPI00101BA1DF|nr:cation diffusion facilitator family transporter [Salipiger sp. IMCC34102]RYH01423.1 cation diffusion facilitator family transporter [Salipiger sp. IMCC34102]